MKRKDKRKCHVVIFVDLNTLSGFLWICQKFAVLKGCNNIQNIIEGCDYFICYCGLTLSHNGFFYFLKLHL